MSQPTQHSLTHVLLVWITILSITQVVFITLFFTAGHHGVCQNSSAVAPAQEMQVQANNITLPHPENSLRLGKGKMLTFKATGAKRTIQWVAKDPSKGLVSGEGDYLTIKQDGYYFLNLQVTMKTKPSCKDVFSHGGGLGYTVSLRWNDKALLQGWIDTNTCSTGLLGKVELLSAGGTLVVTISPPTEHINETESLTHLDIIYMLRP